MLIHRPMKAKNYLRYFIFFGFIFWASMSAGCLKNKDANSGDLNFLDLIKINSQFDRKTATLFVDVKIANGFHAYGDGEPHGKPLRLEIIPKNNWAALGAPIMPSGKKYKFGQHEISVVVEGQFFIKQKLTIGQGRGEALLHFQLCSKTLCDRPRTHAIQFE